MVLHGTIRAALELTVLRIGAALAHALAPR